ncbi:MAG: hypothetical protein WAT17_00660 [Candidatus Saccharimonadales bacterium]|jgi:hypothetical protein
MAAARKPTTKTKKTTKLIARKLATSRRRQLLSVVRNKLIMLGSTIARPFVRWWYRNKNFLSRRSHRSFRWTRRRDMVAIEALPSNIFFTSEVIGMMRRNKGAYITFVILYVILFTAIAGIISQDNYTEFTESLKTAGAEVIGGDIGKTTEIVTSFGAIVTGQLSEAMSDTQQIYISLLSLFTWMAIVWFLRHRLKGITVNVRDAIYNAGAPIVPTLVVALVGMFQLLPGAIGVIIYFAALNLGIISGGVESMLFAVAALLLVVLSLYWVAGTLFGLVVVTIPGTYPFRALSMAGDVIVGRRVGMLVRMLWMVFMLIVIWAFILVPMILLADALPWKWLPLVPITAQLLAGFSILFAATYVYLLYRRMLDAAPKKRSRK